MKSLYVSCILLLVALPAIATTYFIDPAGDNTNAGLSPAFPFATIAYGFSVAAAGDTLLLTKGTFYGTTVLEDKNGTPERPIVLKSMAADPLDFAVIDGESPPSQHVNLHGLHLKDCSWIVIENIVFRNCWRNVINLENSSYVTVLACHFSSGKEVVYPHGEEAHHILVENCYVRHPDEVWRGWSWESIHHGAYQFYNGGLLHPRRSGGGHVLRGNTGINLFNAFRTRPGNIKQDGNIEIYDNSFSNIRDNDFEPEDWAWNLHYHHNWHRNVHKAYSIDDVRGGNMYIFGNTYTQGSDSYSRAEVNGIFKYKDGPLTYPCYVFNNSYFTEARVLKDGEATNHLLKHFNNAYYFFRGSQRFQVDDWQTGYEFDHDVINQEFPANITDNQQEANGLENTDARFVDGVGGDFRLQVGSPAVDAGKIMTFPEFAWTQHFTGNAPDIGAYEGNRPTDGPAFRFIPSPDGAYYLERPRISKHRVDSTSLVLYFSAALDSTSLVANFVDLYQNGMRIRMDTFYFPNHAHELFIETSIPLLADSLSLTFNTRPVGTNGLPVTDWASTLPIGTQVQLIPDLSVVPIEIISSLNDWHTKNEAALTLIPNPAHGGMTFILTEENIPANQTPELRIYTVTGGLVDSHFPKEREGNNLRYEVDQRLPSGMYIGAVQTPTGIVTQKFVIQ
ncbi:MAG: T9SS type A sorting domain-containing protein [Bacteroidota bacterium]